MLRPVLHIYRERFCSTIPPSSFPGPSPTHLKHGDKRAPHVHRRRFINTPTPFQPLARHLRQPRQILARGAADTLRWGHRHIIPRPPSRRGRWSAIIISVTELRPFTASRGRHTGDKLPLVYSGICAAVTTARLEHRVHAHPGGERWEEKPRELGQVKVGRRCVCAVKMQKKGGGEGSVSILLLCCHRRRENMIGRRLRETQYVARNTKRKRCESHEKSQRQDFQELQAAEPLCGSRQLTILRTNAAAPTSHSRRSAP